MRDADFLDLAHAQPQPPSRRAAASTLNKGTITYEEIVTLAYADYPQHPETYLDDQPLPVGRHLELGLAVDVKELEDGLLGLWGRIALSGRDSSAIDGLTTLPGG